MFVVCVHCTRYVETVLGILCVILVYIIHQVFAANPAMNLFSVLHNNIMGTLSLLFNFIRSSIRPIVNTNLVITIN